MMLTWCPELSKRLSELMDERDILTATDLANKTRLSGSFLSDILSSKELSRIFECDKLITLAKYFGVSADWLLGLSDTRYPAGDDKAAVSRVTGFADKSIETLDRWQRAISVSNKKGPDELGRNRLFALNVLLQSPDGEMLLDDLFRYMVTDFDHAITFIEHTFDSGESFEIVNRNRPVSKLRFESVMREPQAPINIPVSYLREALLRESEAKLGKRREDVIRQYGVPYEERERPDNPFRETMNNLRKQEG